MDNKDSLIINNKLEISEIVPRDVFYSTFCLKNPSTPASTNTYIKYTITFYNAGCEDIINYFITCFENSTEFEAVVKFSGVTRNYKHCKIGSVYTKNTTCTIELIIPKKNQRKNQIKQLNEFQFRV